MYKSREHIRQIAVDLILAIVTCGLFNLWVQAKQMDAVNDMLQDEKYNFVPWFFLVIITCGLYHIYHEYRMSDDIARVMGRQRSNDSLIAVILAVFGLALIVDAIQQAHINRHFGSDEL